MARSAAPQHLLSAGPAQGARLAVGKGSTRRGRRAVPRSARVADGRVELSAFTLDDEALVTPLDSARRGAAREAFDRVRVRPARTAPPGRSAGARGRCAPDCDGATRAWLELRTQPHVRRTTWRFHGAAGPRDSARPGRSARSKPIIACPFKFFAQHVLRLEEEPDDEEVMDPRRQGQFVHEVFETFFTRVAGRRPRARSRRRTCRGARELFPTSWIARSSDCRKARRRSSARGCSGRRRRPALAKRCSAWRPSGPCRSSNGCSSTSSTGRSRSRRRRRPAHDSRCAARPIGSTCSSDGTFRLIDYKLGWPPERSARAAAADLRRLCAEQQLDGHRGRKWTLGEAVYLAFKGPKRVVPLFANDGRPRPRCSPTRSSGSPTRSTRSSAASSRRRPTTCSGARRAVRRRSAGRTMSDDDLTPPARQHAVDPSPQRRARGVGRDGQDARARRALRQPAAGRRRARITSWRSPSPARPPPRCASGSSSGCARPSRLSQFDAARWRELKERLGDIAISTIDAFCLSLLREFPLEADVDPGLRSRRRHRGSAADRASRSIRRSASAAASRATTTMWRWCSRSCGERRLRTGLAALLDRRLVAPQALRRYLSSGPRDLDRRGRLPRARPSDCATRSSGVAGGLDAFLARRSARPSAVRDAGRRHPRCCRAAGSRATVAAARGAGRRSARWSIGCAPTS